MSPKTARRGGPAIHGSPVDANDVLPVLTCQPCDRARDTGWHGLPEGHGHCRDCHTEYQGRQQHCVRCHETFGGDEAATRHWGRDGNCVDPASVLHRETQRRILTRNAAGVWIRVFGQ